MQLQKKNFFWCIYNSKTFIIKCLLRFTCIYLWAMLWSLAMCHEYWMMKIVWVFFQLSPVTWCRWLSVDLGCVKVICSCTTWTKTLSTATTCAVTITRSYLTVWNRSTKSFSGLDSSDVSQLAFSLWSHSTQCRLVNCILSLQILLPGNEQQCCL